MDKSKTIETINKFYTLVGSEDPTPEDKDFVRYFELELAKSMLNEFDNDTNRRLARILLAYTNTNSNQSHYTTESPIFL